MNLALTVMNQLGTEHTVYIYLLSSFVYSTLNPFACQVQILYSILNLYMAPFIRYLVTSIFNCSLHIASEKNCTATVYTADHCGSNKPNETS